jgi:transcriptional regulator with XRE-family HTH domain
MDYGVDSAAMAEQIAAAVRRLRKARGWTQQQLADAIGKHRSTVHLVEKGDRDHDLATIQKIADVLGVTIGEITGESSDEERGLSRTALRLAQIYDDLIDPEDQAAVKRFFSWIESKRASDH